MSQAPMPQAQIHPSQNTQPQMQQRMRAQRMYAVTGPAPPRSKKDSACYESMIACFGVICGTLGSIPGCCCFPNPFRPVYQGTVGLVVKFGRFVDVRTRCEDIPRQLALTKDNVSIDIDSVLYWSIEEPYIATFLVSDVKKALIERTQTTLRFVLGSRTLQDAIEHRDEMQVEIREIIDKVAEGWGVNVEAILLKDVIMGREILASMAAAATQKRLGESKVIAAQAEVQSATLMRQAADILNSPAAMQIRYLETLQQMAAQPGTKVIFLPSSEDSPSSPEIHMSMDKKK